MILVDTSVWIATFAKKKPFDLEAIIDMEQIVTCLPVIQEVLQGFKDEWAFRLARDALTSIPIVEASMTLDLFEEAVGFYRAARRQGVTVRYSVDCLVAACAIRHDLEVLHRDRDFEQLARVTQLRQRTV